MKSSGTLAVVGIAAVVGAVVVAVGVQTAIADSSKSSATAKTASKSKATKPRTCRQTLSALGVPFKQGRGNGIADAVEITGTIGLVSYRGYGKQKSLTIDCSLAVSLAIAAPYFGALGVTSVRYSSAYQRRFIRGTKRLSRHSFGLAIDIHTFSGKAVGDLTIRDDYEQGLGDNIDCIGEPLTEGGLVLRKLWCQLERSELFRIILDPDFDEDHYNHLHVEALPWSERLDLALIAERLSRR